MNRLAPLAIALAAWTALPSLEWCPLSWKECRAACEGRAEVAATCEGMEDCAGAASEAACATPLCDPVPDRDLPFGDRAWCIHPPLDGVPSRGLEVSATFVAFTLPATAHELSAPPEVRIAHRGYPLAASFSSQTRARPPARAPPVA